MSLGFGGFRPFKVYTRVGNWVGGGSGVQELKFGVSGASGVCVCNSGVC